MTALEFRGYKKIPNFKTFYSFARLLEQMSGTITMAEQQNGITGIFKSMSKKLLAFIRGRVGSNEDAEDILQEVFYQFAGRSESVEEAGSWLYKTARNKIIDSYRKKKLPLTDDIFFSEEEGEVGWQELVLAEDADPETEQMRMLFWETLQEALDELPPEQKEAFIQNEIEDISFKDLSDKTGVSVATLISRKRYAVLHLRERLRSLKKELLNI